MSKDLSRKERLRKAIFNYSDIKLLHCDSCEQLIHRCCEGSPLRMNNEGFMICIDCEDKE